MIKPRALKAGDVVGVISPSDAVDRVDLEGGIELLKSWGLKVRVGKHVYSKVGDFMAGTEEERQEDLRSMIFDDEVRCVWATTGGYAATEVLPAIDRETVTHLRQNPKWFVGYSDVCLILNSLLSRKLASIQGPTLWGLPDWDEVSHVHLKKILFGEEVWGIDDTFKWTAAIPGVAEGSLIAADLETLIFTFGTKHDPLMFGTGQVILSIEELDIEKSTLQRQIDVILSHKKVSRISGWLVGRLVNIRELSYPVWGKDVTPQDIVTSRIKKFGKSKIPLAFLDDVGHAEWDYDFIPESMKKTANHTFLPLVNGIKARLTVGEKCSLEYLEKTCNIA